MRREAQIILLSLAIPALGQVSNPSIINVTNAPSGSCSSGLPNQQVVSTGVQYSCQSGTWASIGGGGGGGFGGTVTYTSSHTLSTSDNGLLVVMNCSSACTLTLPNPQPSTTFLVDVQSIGSTTATVALGPSMTYNGGASVPILLKYLRLPIVADSGTSTNYIGGIPPVPGSNVTLTSAANGLTIASSGSGSAPTGTGVPQVVSGAWGTTVDMGTVAAIPLVSNGTHNPQLANGQVATGGSGSSALNFTTTTVSGLSSITTANSYVLTAGATLVEVSDAASCGDTTTGGGTITEILRAATVVSGAVTAWTLVTCSSAIGSSGYVAVPLNPTSTGSAGQWAVDPNYFYAYDSATPRWRRAAWTTWNGVAFVRSATTNQGAGANETSVFSSNTATDSIYVFCGTNVPSGTPITVTASDTQGNTYTELTGYPIVVNDTAGHQQYDIFKNNNIASSAGNTVTCNATGGSYYFALALEYSGSSGQDGTTASGASNGGTGTALSAGPITITAGDTVLMFGAGGNSTAPTPGAGFTGRGGTYTFFMVADKIAATGTSATCTASMGSANGWGLSCAAIH